MKRFITVCFRALILTALATPLTIVSAQAGKSQSHQHPARLDPDRHFLRDLADHNEAMVYLAHSAMQMKHAHAGGQDKAGALDVAEDARKREIANVLKSLFKDETAPQVPSRLRQQVDSILRLEGEAYEKTVREFTLSHHRAAIVMIDRAKPRRKAVTALLRRVRAQYVQELKKA